MPITKKRLKNNKQYNRLLKPKPHKRRQLNLKHNVKKSKDIRSIHQ